MNQETAQYYRITEKAYRALDPVDTPFMNLGLWPAASIREAQSRMVQAVVTALDEGLSVADRRDLRLLELGPGWGGSRKLIYEKWPHAPYFGLNCSREQITYAEHLNRSVPQTRYVQGFFEELAELSFDGVNAAIGVEAVIHIDDKQRFFQNCADRGIRHLAMAEICSEDRDEIRSNPLFNPSLKYTWPLQRYCEALPAAGYTNLKVKVVTDQVFTSWSSAIDAVDLHEFAGHPRVLRQFKASYSKLAELGQQDKVQFAIITARRD